jgi:acetyltransferase-like isoleucine patch superfamily enzyme
MNENLFFNKRDLKYCGNNVIIGKTVRIRNPHLVSIGDGSIIDDFTYISTALDIGQYCHIASNVNISGGKGKLYMNNFSGLSSHTSVHCASSDYGKLSFELPSIPSNFHFGGVNSDIVIEKYVLVGAHSCILPGAFLPEGSAYGAYTLIRNIKYKPYHLYFGNKCTDLGERDLSNLNNLKEMENQIIKNGYK